MTETNEPVGESQTEVAAPVTPMRRYQSHKQVLAAQIVGITDPSPAENQVGHVRLHLDTNDHVDVDRRYMAKHEPKVGGYLVVYADGYRSFSPADVFEAGYKEIDLIDPASN